MLKNSFEMWWPKLEKVISEFCAPKIDKSKRNPEEMLEEILNSVRALSNMISEQGWPRSVGLSDIFRALRPYPASTGIGSGSTGRVMLSRDELAALLVAASKAPLPSLSPSPSLSEEPADDENEKD